MNKLFQSLRGKISSMLSDLKGLNPNKAENKIFVSCLFIALVSSQLLNTDWHSMIKIIIDVSNKISIAIIAGIILKNLAN